MQPKCRFEGDAQIFLPTRFGRGCIGKRVCTVHSPSQWHSEVAHTRNWRAGGSRRKAQTLTAKEPKAKYLPVATWPGKSGKVKTDQVQLWWPRWILFIVNKNTPKRSSSLYIKLLLSVRSAQNFNGNISYNLWSVVWGYCIHSITVSAHSHGDD